MASSRPEGKQTAKRIASFYGYLLVTELVSLCTFALLYYWRPFFSAQIVAAIWTLFAAGTVMTLGVVYLTENLDDEDKYTFAGARGVCLDGLLDQTYRPVRCFLKRI